MPINYKYQKNQNPYQSGFNSIYQYQQPAQQQVGLSPVQQANVYNQPLDVSSYGDLNNQEQLNSGTNIGNVAGGINSLGQQVIQGFDEPGGSVAGSTASGALSGAASGAMIGSVVPGIGTAIGAVGGALIGGASSYFGASSAEEAENKAIRKAEKQARENQMRQQKFANLQPQQQYAANFANGGFAEYDLIDSNIGNMVNANYLQTGGGLQLSTGFVPPIDQNPLTLNRQLTQYYKNKDQFEIEPSQPLQLDPEAAKYIRKNFEYPYSNFVKVKKKGETEDYYYPILDTMQLDKLTGVPSKTIKANGGSVNFNSKSNNNDLSSTQYTNDKELGYIEYKNGGSHEVNPLGGVPIGNDNFVEQGEVKHKSKKYGDYVFSNRF